MSKKLKILLLFDLSVSLSAEKYDEYWKTPDWKTENDVRNALLKLGHEVIPLGIYNDIESLIKIVRENKPDLVFNLSEAFNNDRDLEPNITSLLQLFGIPFTGTGPVGLTLCKNKGLTKEVLAYHRIRIPRFVVAKKNRPLRNLNRFEFPAFIKPLRLESSEGISQYSFAENQKDALARMKYVHERLGADAIIEEYIDGRELYVSILGNEKLTVFPPRELFFKQVPDDEPKFATFRSKWDNEYRKKWGIDTGVAKSLPASVQEKLEEVSKAIYRHLQIQGYGRIDFRVKENGEIYFIEANPNPSIHRTDDYALSAEKGGMPYEDLIAKIISLAGA